MKKSKMKKKIRNLERTVGEIIDILNGPPDTVPEPEGEHDLTLQGAAERHAEVG